MSPGAAGLKRLLELLLEEQRAGHDPATLKRVLGVLEAIGQRSAYFSLLVENRRAREQLLATCRHGDFLASQLARNPALLDELLDERWKVALPDAAQLAAEMRQRLADVPADDLEREVEALARFKQAAVFRVALADLSGRLPLMQVSDRLTDIAALILEHTMQLAFLQISARHGAPQCRDEQGLRPVRIAALGYGKLGGYELGYASDLDLVFLHDSAGEQQETDAPVPLDNQVFFLRYAQRLIHLLTMHSAGGRLYEVDVRLRPVGQGRHAGDEHRRLPPLPVRGGMDLGTPGTAACARGGGRCCADGAHRVGAHRSAARCRAARRSAWSRYATCASACAANFRRRRPGNST